MNAVKIHESAIGERNQLFKKGIGYWRVESTFQERDWLDTIFLVQNASRCQQNKTSMQADGAFYSVGFERIHHQTPVHHI